MRSSPRATGGIPCATWARSTARTSTGNASKRRSSSRATRCRSGSSSSSTWRRRTSESPRWDLVSGRTYLSIGDVLALLRQEFPDVTISKIRFLESQGLVNPERSPSGYRKFYDHDVERLRWVLRQQREHFLPLKVIRDRLADGDLGDDVGAEQPNGKAARPTQAVAVAG